MPDRRRTDIRSGEEAWTAADAEALYGVADWGHGYFGVDEQGHMAVLPDKDRGRIDIHEIVKGLVARGYTTPVLLRFYDVLRHRFQEIADTFAAVMKEYGYQGRYSCVYPIKVNQQKHLCRDIRDLAAQHGFGFEAGSKPELLAVLALTEGHQQMPIVCNGFKDDEYVETVILATKLGRTIFPVVEKFGELEMIVKHALDYGVTPRLGIRVKLTSTGKGRWEQSAGVRGKFGLNFAEVLRAVEFLKGNDMLGAVDLLHCHIGSQVGDMRDISRAVNELSHVYVELHRMGAPLGYIDVGGGLGVDYDGSRSTGEASINYSMREYAAGVVWKVQSVCDQAGVPHPVIMTESGRALVTYSSVLVTDVVGKTTTGNAVDHGTDAPHALASETPAETPAVLNDLRNCLDEAEQGDLAEVFHDATQAREDAARLFELGYLSLPARAATEQLFFATGHKLWARMRAMEDAGTSVPDELGELPLLLADVYFLNFSVFQSMPDSWAIDQRFPICPIHRLAERPLCRATLADITCDSDGKIDEFVGGRDPKPFLELHELVVDGDGRIVEPYYVGFFLLGAYQEILGDLHNLLGDTHAVHIRLGDDGDWSLDEVIVGDTVREVLSYVQFDPEGMLAVMRRDVEAAVKARRLTIAEARSFLQFYTSGLDGYTYLEP